MQWEYVITGAVAGLAKTLVQEGGIVLPKVENGKLYLGGFTSVLLGAIGAGIFGTNLPNAFATGYAGPAIFEQGHNTVTKLFKVYS